MFSRVSALLFLLFPARAAGNQTGSMAAAEYANVAADSPAIGAAASLKSLVITPEGDPSVVVDTVVVCADVLKVVLNGSVGAEAVVVLAVILGAMLVLIGVGVVLSTYSVIEDIEGI